MVLGLEAGQSLDAVLIEACRQLRDPFRELCAELSMVEIEIIAGKSRAEALRNLASRNQEIEVSRFARLLLDADRFGTSLAPALRAHVHYLRVRMRQKAHEAARKVAVKMVFPLFFLIFPSILLVTLGPAVLQIVSQLQPLLSSGLLDSVAAPPCYPLNRMAARHGTCALPWLLLPLLLSAPARAADVCSDEELEGPYGFLLSGRTTISGSETPVVSLGRIVLDDEGIVSGSSSVHFNGLLLGNPVTGAYEVNSDCSMTMSLQDTSGAFQHFGGKVTPGGDKVTLYQTDPGAARAALWRKPRTRAIYRMSARNMPSPCRERSPLWPPGRFRTDSRRWLDPRRCQRSLHFYAKARPRRRLQRNHRGRHFRDSDGLHRPNGVHSQGRGWPNRRAHKKLRAVLV